MLPVGEALEVLLLYFPAESRRRRLLRRKQPVRRRNRKLRDVTLKIRRSKSDVNKLCGGGLMVLINT
jgi:hypothetical protein